ncbi:unnamed protein product [Adineta ricciae]|uniref:ATP-grasp domain-containing protein n=1 Tax=Adineta ricciae TaxID=249248 RepID=A0A815YD03_ADIRI|nr:unnamed protein product [Adineta ricciae]
MLFICHKSIVDIVKRERIDFFVPVSHSSTECLDALIPLKCQTIHGDLEQVQMLCDKYLFIVQTRAFGLTVPKSYRITDPKQILTFDFTQDKCHFILKRIEYDCANRTKMVKLLCEARVHTCCESSTWLLNYKHVENKSNIFQWVDEFCSKANLTGQVAFDYIESHEDGLIYRLECNARTHTAIMTFYNQPLVADAYLGTEHLVNGPI